MKVWAAFRLMNYAGEDLLGLHETKEGALTACEVFARDTGAFEPWLREGERWQRLFSNDELYVTELDVGHA